MLGVQSNRRSSARRRQVYVDAEIQRRIVLALVAIEVLVLALACLMLARSFPKVVAGATAASGEAGLLRLLAAEFGRVALYCGIANVLAVLAAHALWARHVRKVLSGFARRLARVRALDLRREPARQAATHRLLDLCDRWIEGERRRMLAVRIAAARLPRPLPADPRSHEAAEALAALQEAAALLRRQAPATPPPTLSESQ